VQVTMTVNGEQVTREVEPRLLLVHFIRDHLGLTGTHWGCDTSNCGVCVLWMDGEPVKSCTVLTAMAGGREIRTVEEHSSRRQVVPGRAFAHVMGGGAPCAIARIEERAIGSVWGMERCFSRLEPRRAAAPVLAWSRHQPRELVPGSSLPARTSNVAGG